MNNPTLNEIYSATFKLSDEALLNDLESSIVRFAKEPDGATGYKCMVDIVTDLEVVKLRLTRSSKVEEQSARYFKWWREAERKNEKLEEKLRELTDDDFD